MCRCGGIGRRTGFKIQRETMWVRVPPSVPVWMFLWDLAFHENIFYIIGKFSELPII